MLGKSFVALLLLASQSVTQHSNSKNSERSKLPVEDAGSLESGTCAVVAGFRDSFAIGIDSLITKINPDTQQVVGHQTGCKVRSIAPGILAIAVGQSSFSRDLVKWKALDAASNLMSTRPAIQSFEDMDSFARAWADDLAVNARRAYVVPDKQTDSLVDLYVATAIQGRPVGYEIVINYDGKLFSAETYTLDRQINDPRSTGAQTYFIGYCRRYLRVRDYKTNEVRVPVYPPNAKDSIDMENLQKFQDHARTGAELLQVVLGYEAILSRIDIEEQGASAVIGPPFSTAVGIE